MNKQGVEIGGNMMIKYNEQAGSRNRRKDNDQIEWNSVKKITR
jgi:hypothetical protein